MGYKVDTIDYSKALVERAIQLTRVVIKLQNFYEINEYEKYDGI